MAAAVELAPAPSLAQVRGSKRKQTAAEPRESPHRTRREGAVSDLCGACAKPVPWDREMHTQDPRHHCNACKRVVHSSRFMCTDAGALMTSLIADDGVWY